MKTAGIITAFFFLGTQAFAQQSLRYFYDDANELYRVLDSTGTMIEYTYDRAGNITNVARTTVQTNALEIFNVTPSMAIGGSTIMIFGQNFSSIAAGDIVTIGGVPATVLSASATQLVLRVPQGTNGGAVSLTVGGVTVTWSNTISVTQPPIIQALNPTSGKKNAAALIMVTGQYLQNATYVLQSVDPTYTSPGGTISVASSTDTNATLNAALGGTEGLFSLIATTSVGTSTVTPASLFVIGPAAGSASFYASVLNTAFNPSTNPPLPAGQNTTSFYASVLNTGYNPVLDPPFPPGQNLLSFYASVLNTAFDPTLNPPLPAGQNAASFYASVLNTGYSPTLNSPYPPGQNNESFYASVLNIGFDPSHPLLPPGQNNASYFVSVCNTSFGCTATAPAAISASASTSKPVLPGSQPVAQSPSNSLTPILESASATANVTTGQTIRLTARNVDTGSLVKFRVNGAVIDNVSQEPYETLFTIPDGQTILFFDITVQDAERNSRTSQVTQMIVKPDVGAKIQGTIAQNATDANSKLSLSLSAGGLKSEFFRISQPVTGLPSLDALQPVRTDYVTAINEPNPGSVFGDDPLGAHLGSDYAIRFSGKVRVEVAGLYQFWLTARSGATISIDGKPLTDSGVVSGDPDQKKLSTTLDRGWHSLEINYYLAIGPSGIRLDWQPPGSAHPEVLGPESLRTTLEGVTAIPDSKGSFVFAQVPMKFDSVWIGAKEADRFVEFSAVKPGDNAVTLVVPK